VESPTFVEKRKIKRKRRLGERKRERGKMKREGEFLSYPLDLGQKKN